MSRRHLDDGQGITTSLIGHENVVDVVVNRELQGGAVMTQNSAQVLKS